MFKIPSKIRVVIYSQLIESDAVNSVLRIVSAHNNIGGPKMSGNFVRERQRIVYIYNIHKVGNLISPDEHMTFVKHKIHRTWN